FSCPPHPRDLHSFPTRRSSDLSLELNDRSALVGSGPRLGFRLGLGCRRGREIVPDPFLDVAALLVVTTHRQFPYEVYAVKGLTRDRKSTRLNSSHRTISYAVFC